MASKSTACLALFLILNLLIFNLTAACSSCDIQPGHRNESLSDSHWPWHRPTPTPTPSSYGKCPRDALKFGICTDVVKGYVLNVTLGQPPVEPCCSLIDGLIDLEAALCFCTAIKANVLGFIHLDIPISISLILNACGKEYPSGFECAGNYTQPPVHG